MRGLNKTELAKLANMSVGSLSHIEKETRKPSLEMLYTIADALNVSIINLVIDEKEIERFYYDDLMKAYYPGSERLKEIIDRLIENGTVWENAERIAIVDISSKNKKKRNPERGDGSDVIAQYRGDGSDVRTVLQ